MHLTSLALRCRYHTLRKKVEGGSIYSDDQFKGYAGASEGAEGTANPTAADTTL